MQTRTGLRDLDWIKAFVERLHAQSPPTLRTLAAGVCDVGKWSDLSGRAAVAHWPRRSLAAPSAPVL